MFKKGASFTLRKIIGGTCAPGLYKDVTSDQISKVRTLLIVCAVLIGVFMYAAYTVEAKVLKKEKRKKKGTNSS